MCSSPFVNSLNFGPLNCIVMGFRDLDWAIRSVRRILLAPRGVGLRSPGIIHMLMFMSSRPSRCMRRILSLADTHRSAGIWLRGKISALCNLFL